MGKDRLLRCLINMEKRQDKVGDIIIRQKDIDALEGNRKEAFEGLCKEFTQRFIGIRDTFTKMKLVLTSKEIFAGKREKDETK